MKSNMDDAAMVAYQYWLQTKEGKIAFHRKELLIKHLISLWPRRNQRLLEVGCGLGMFLELFWRCGFEVIGLDTSQAILEATRSRLGNRVELHLGQTEHLPFQNNEFDFVALLTVLEFVKDPAATLREAARVARKGLLLCFLNKCSCYYLAQGLVTPWNNSNLLHCAHWFSPWEIRRLLVRTLGRRPIYSRSVLHGPPWSWRKSLLGLRSANSLLLPSVVGAYIGIRVHLLEDKPLTPLYACTTEPRILR